MSAAVSARDAGTTYDPGIRKRATRQGRQRGCRVYIPMEVLVEAGFSPDDPPPFYRLVGHRRSRNAGSVIVSLYREP